MLIIIPNAVSVFRLGLSPLHMCDAVSAFATADRFSKQKTRREGSKTNLLLMQLSCWKFLKKTKIMTSASFFCCYRYHNSAHGQIIKLFIHMKHLVHVNACRDRILSFSVHVKRGIGSSGQPRFRTDWRNEHV